MRRGKPLAVSVAALVVVAGAHAASATDAQVKTAVAKEISAVAHQKGKTLQKAAAAARTALAAAKPVSSKAVSARALGLQAAGKASLAGAEQVKADADNTRMDYNGATAQTALATKNLVAAGKLLNKAAVLLGMPQRAP